jgi:type VI secretion system protein VasI
MVFALALALALVVPAQEDVLKRLQTCAAISDSLQRLSCFDALATTAGALAATPVATASAGGEAAAGNWSVKESIDPLTDKPTLIATLAATEKNGAISLRCKGGETDVLLNLAHFLGSDAVAVTYRLDDEKAKTERWKVSTDHKAAFAPKAFDLCTRLTSAGRLITQAAPFSSSPVTSTFDLTGIGVMVEKLRRICPTN